MRRRRAQERFSKLMLAAALGCWSIGGCRQSAGADFRPNVVLLVLDTFRADRLGVTGYPLPTTPHLDALARHAVVFRNAYSPATWTKPAMASLFASVWPSEHGVLNDRLAREKPLLTRRFHDSFETVAETLQAGGYSTGAVANQALLKKQTGFAQGFEGWHWSRGKSAHWVNERGLALIDVMRARPQPFFAWLHYMDVHSPYTKSLPATAGSFGATALAELVPQQRSDFLALERNGVSEDDARALGALYDQEVSYLDDALGRLFDELAARRLLESTVLVITADHGEGFAEHGRLHHGFEPYDEVAKVPLIVVGPERLAWKPGIRTSPVSLVDIAPTFLDLAGLPPVAAHRGRSLLAILEGEEELEHEIFLQTDTVLAMRSAAHKVWIDADHSSRLYDLGADPAESIDLAAAGCEERCRRLTARLEKFRLALAPPPHVELDQLNDDDRAALTALGYL
jgi:arylsulfatase A-like enzyme